MNKDGSWSCTLAASLHVSSHYLLLRHTPRIPSRLIFEHSLQAASHIKGQGKKCCVSSYQIFVSIGPSQWNRIMPKTFGTATRTDRNIWNMQWEFHYKFLGIYKEFFSDGIPAYSNSRAEPPSLFWSTAASFRPPPFTSPIEVRWPCLHLGGVRKVMESAFLKDIASSDLVLLA